MNKKFNFIINILIIILIIALVAVMMNYYMDANVIPTSKYSSGDDSQPYYSTNNTSGEQAIIDKIISLDNTSGDYNKIEVSGDVSKPINSGDASIKVSGDTGSLGEINVADISGDINNQNANNETNNVNIKDKNEATTLPVIITSENETSSKEKQEILGEIDKTLMELLEVVDRVQTVDETRLILDDSEVQK